jgi:hypothetical protein
LCDLKRSYQPCGIVAGRKTSEELLQTTTGPGNNAELRKTNSQLFSLGNIRGGGGLAGKTIEAAGLRGLPDVFLVAIERNTTTLHAVAPSEVLLAGDILWFAGSAEGVITLRKIPGVACLARAPGLGDQAQDLLSCNCDILMFPCPSVLLHGLLHSKLKS